VKNLFIKKNISTSQLYNFTSSRLHDFTTPQLYDFTPHLASLIPQPALIPHTSYLIIHTSYLINFTISPPHPSPHQLPQIFSSFQNRFWPFTKAESNHSRVSLVLVKRTKRYCGNLVFFREPNAEFLVR